MKTHGSDELPWQIASDGNLQRRAMADPLPCVKYSPANKNVVEKKCPSRKYHIYECVRLSIFGCTSSKGNEF